MRHAPCAMMIHSAMRPDQMHPNRMHPNKDAKVKGLKQFKF
jgi:hypothetical protein